MSVEVVEQQVKEDPGLTKWKQGVVRGQGDPRWNEHDCVMQSAATEYNRHLNGTAGYRPLDWLWIKAMSWVESGPHNPEWKRKPLQIGVPTDPGLGALFGGKEGGDLIVPPGMVFTMASARSDPTHNIRAAIGYLMMRMADYAFRTIPDSDTTIHRAPVRDGDSLAKIARERGTTIEVLQTMNPQAKVLRKGQMLEYRKAAIRKVIIGWHAFTPQEVARRYNGGGDVFYASKLTFALPLVRGAKVAAC